MPDCSPPTAATAIQSRQDPDSGGRGSCRAIDSSARQEPRPPGSSHSFSPTMTPDEFRRIGHRLIDWIADYRATVASRPVMARTEPGDVKSSTAGQPAGASRSRSTPSSATWTGSSCPGCRTGSTRSSSATSRATARWPACSATTSARASACSASSWQSSPALTELEEVVTDWMRQMVGLSDAWSGVIQDTASTCTMIALLCARERTTDYGVSRGGLQAEAQPLVVYTSAQSHSSVDKAALLAGFGRDNVRVVPHDDRLRDAPRRAGRGDRTTDLRAGATVRDRRHHRHHDVDGARSDRRHRGRRRATRPLAARGRGDGRLGDDAAGVPLDVGRASKAPTRSCQPAQVARRRRSTAPCTTCATRSTWCG